MQSMMILSIIYIMKSFTSIYCPRVDAESPEWWKRVGRGGGGHRVNLETRKWGTSLYLTVIQLLNIIIITGNI